MATYRAFYIAGPGRRSWQDRLKIALAAVVGLGSVFI